VRRHVTVRTSRVPSQGFHIERISPNPGLTCGGKSRREEALEDYRTAVEACAGDGEAQAWLEAHQDLWS